MQFFSIAHPEASRSKALERLGTLGINCNAPVQVENVSRLPETPTSRGLHNHMIQNVRGVGPRALKVWTPALCRLGRMFRAASPMLHRTSPITGWHHGNSPSSAQELYKHFRTAEEIIAMMDRPDANKQLEKCSGIGPGKSSQIMKSWQDKKNRREQFSSREPSLPFAEYPRNRMHVSFRLVRCFLGREMPPSLRHEVRAPRGAPARPAMF